MPSMVPGAQRVGAQPPAGKRAGGSVVSFGKGGGSPRRQARVSFFGGAGSVATGRSGLGFGESVVSSASSGDGASASSATSGGAAKLAMRAFRSGSFRHGSKRRLMAALDKAEGAEVREMLERVCPVGLAGMYSLTANVQQLRAIALRVLQESEAAMKQSRSRWDRVGIVSRKPGGSGAASGSGGVMAAVPFA